MSYDLFSIFIEFVWLIPTLLEFRLVDEKWILDGLLFLMFSELVCGQGCCSETVEEDLLRRSQIDFVQAVTNVMNSTSDIFSFHKSKFEGQFVCFGKD